jgi:uncharacterized protein YndB with AHSA1/START domain
MANVMSIRESPAGDSIAEKTVQIEARPSKVWDALTDPRQMQKWMSETQINIVTDGKVGGPILIHGYLHRIKFQNKGTILQYEREKILQYSHLSSLSRLPDELNNYTIFTFVLTPVGDHTSLTLTLSNFPTESILKHLVFYWNVTLEILKRMIEAKG